MHDIRWFSDMGHGALVVPRLEALGLSIAQTGDAPARLALALGNPFAAAAWRFGARHRCPVVQFIWDLPPWRLGNGRPDRTWSVLGRLVSFPRLRHRYAERRSTYSKLHYVATHARAIWVPSETTRADVRSRFGVLGNHVQYCYDSDRFTPGGVRTAPPTLLSVSRLVHSKNHEAVIRAAHRLGMAVRIVGAGQLRDSLQRLAAELRVPCSVSHGRVSDRDVVEAYRQATVVVCPSRFEGMGLSGLEGAACGIPVVASDISPHREFLGTVAHFFTLDDDDSLDRAIHEAIAAPPPSADRITAFSIDAAAHRFYHRLTTLLERPDMLNSLNSRTTHTAV